MTGSTGFLGSELLRILCTDQSVSRIVTFISPSPGFSAAEKLGKITEKWSLDPLCDTSKIQIVPYRLGFAYRHDPNLYTSRFEYFIHLAGLTDLNPSLDTARRNNVFATQEALRIACQSQNIKRFTHVSTAYVCGKHDTLITEDMPAQLYFNNAYERTKYEAEQTVTRMQLPYTIVRPSIIVGRQSDGYFPRTKVIYSLWKAWLRGIAPRIPVDRQSFVDIVPLDWVCAVIWELTRNPLSLNGIFHACAGADRQNNLELINLASRIFQVNLPKTCPKKILDIIQYPIVKHAVPYDLQKIITEFNQLLIYMNSKKRVFSMEKTNAILGSRNLILEPFHRWGPILFEYFCKTISLKKIKSQNKV